MASRSRAPTTDISSPPVITRCCCSTVKATAWPPSCGPVTSTAPRAGSNFCCPRSNANSGRLRQWSSGLAAFAKPEIYEALEKRDVKYAIRLPPNDNLQRNITEFLIRPVGRPSYKPVVWFKSFLY